MLGRVGGVFLNGWLGIDMELEGESERDRDKDEEGDSGGLGHDFGFLAGVERVNNDNDGSTGLVSGVELVELDAREACGGFGLALPVGPLPNAGRVEGGRLSAWRNCSFSSSSSATLCSKAWYRWGTRLGDEEIRQMADWDGLTWRWVAR